MKMNKLTAAVAATFAATVVHAQFDFGSVDTNPGFAGGEINVGACAIVSNTAITDALRTLQGGDAACAGSTDAACAPSLSSAELRALVTGGVANAAFITNADGDTLAANTGIKKGALVTNISNGCSNAVNAFAQAAATIGGSSCGLGPAINAAAGNDAAVLLAVAPGAATHQIGVISSTSMDDAVPFIKLDGVAPSVQAVASSNYNLISNLSGGAIASDASANGITVGVVTATASNGVAYRNVATVPANCGPLVPGGALTDVSGGAI